MSNEHLEKYKDMYAEYVKHLTEMYNNHVVFIEHTGRHSTYRLRKNLRLMTFYQKEMSRMANLAWRRNLEIKKEQEKADKIAKKIAKQEEAKSKKRKWTRRNDNNSRTNQTTD